MGQQDSGGMSYQSKDIARVVLTEPRESYQKIADRFGMSRQRVGQIAQKLGIARGRSRMSNRRKRYVGE
jgi:uncharacterized protein YdbL (DUF1318 family)